MVGLSKAGWGVNGESTSGVGVRGISKTGWGVNGESESGSGVRGKGGQLAGLFEGNVQVNGDLHVKGSDLLKRIVELEAQVKILLIRLDLQQPGSSSAYGGYINVGQLADGRYSVHGQDFTANSAVMIRVATPLKLVGDFPGQIRPDGTFDQNIQFVHPGEKVRSTSLAQICGRTIPI